MNIVYFTHSLRSCWNHGNAHFLRGVLRELIARGHHVRACEPERNWSLDNLLADHGEKGLESFHSSYPDLQPCAYAAGEDPVALAQDADLVIVHEWNDPTLVAALGVARQRGGRFTLLFHDTHHRAVSEPNAIRAFDLSAYDGVLAFGEALADVYRRWGWANRVWTWHEAADTHHFHPPAEPTERHGIIWIGNWGDDERTREIGDYLLRPAEAAGMPLDIYGVRYPPQAIRTLLRHHARYHGWVPNARVPELFARHLATVHVPRRYYATVLPGIPTIRVFEALACGIPLVTAPWSDSERLFTPGEDFLVAHSGAEMTRHLRALTADAALRAHLISHGIATIRERHSCAHRAGELLTIVAGLRPASVEPQRNLA
ncbi:CgeB family protein [Flavisphingomonas formosensis]|uniref:CgeB family protein n=1 Tax=Flavisphingomonas formosensis TaxID=861534 RepID=UPI0012F998A9|nr:glycosyltransferase [Sphingomonas formosensis]